MIESGEPIIKKAHARASTLEFAIELESVR